MLKQLIINADDFGLSPGVNRAVEIAWREGVLTQASIMAGAAAFDEAVEIAHRNPGLQVGLHLTLVQGIPVLPPSQIPGLVADDGNFPDNPVTAGMRLFFDRGLRNQLRNEIEAQILKLKATGIPLSHIDGHLNIQMHPTVFELLCELMPKHGITSFRITSEGLKQNLQYSKKRMLGKAAERLIFGQLSNHALPYLQKLGIKSANGIRGLYNSGQMDEAYLLDVIRNLPPGLTELYMHPGCLPDAEISRRMPDYHHEDELQALTSPLVRKALQEAGVMLCNYRNEEKINA